MTAANADLVLPNRALFFFTEGKYSKYAFLKYTSFLVFYTKTVNDHSELNILTQSPTFTFTECQSSYEMISGDLKSLLLGHEVLPHARLALKLNFLWSYSGVLWPTATPHPSPSHLSSWTTWLPSLRPHPSLHGEYSRTSVATGLKHLHREREDERSLPLLLKVLV